MRGEGYGISACGACGGSSREGPIAGVEGDAGRQSAGFRQSRRGEPLAVTVNEPAVPTVKVVLLALVIAGALGSCLR